MPHELDGSKFSPPRTYAGIDKGVAFRLSARLYNLPSLTGIYLSLQSLSAPYFT